MAPAKERKRVGFTGPGDVELWADTTTIPARSLRAPSPILSPKSDIGQLDPMELQLVLSSLVEGEGDDGDHHHSGSLTKSMREPSSCRSPPGEPPSAAFRPGARRLATYDGGSSLSALCESRIDNDNRAQAQSEAAAHRRANRLHDTINDTDRKDTTRSSQAPSKGDYFDSSTRSSSGNLNHNATSDGQQDLWLVNRARNLKEMYHRAAVGLVPKPNFRLYDLKSQYSWPTTETCVVNSTDSPDPLLSRGILGNLWRLHIGKVGSSPPSTPGTPPIETPAMTPTVSRQVSRQSSVGSQSQHGFRTGGGALTPGGLRTPSAVASIAKHFSKRPRNDARITKHMADVMSRQRYLILLCQVMMTYGAPTHRLEDYMHMSAKVLTVEAQFLYVPGRMLISFDDKETYTAQVKLVRAKQSTDLGRLRDVHEIYKEVVHDKLSALDALPRLQEIIDRKPRFSTLSRIIVYGLASAFIGPVGFQARLVDMPIAFLIGCIVGVLELVVTPRSDSFSHVFEVTTAIVATLLARAFGSIRGGNVFCFGALAQSGIVLILPGYMILCASLELQSRNITAGGVRMVYALIYTLFLSYGMMIGASLYGFMDAGATDTTQCTEPLAEEWRFLFSALFTLCLCIIFQAKWKQMPFMVFLALVGTTVSFFVSKQILNNNQFVTAAAAFAVGFSANANSRFGPIVEEYVGKTWARVVASRLSPAARREKAHEEAVIADDKFCGDIESGFSSRKLPRIVSGILATEQVPKLSSDADADAADATDDRKSGYGSAASTMLPAILLMVPGGLAANGSLLAGIQYANEITSKSDITAQDGTARILLGIIQIAIGMSVGLFLGVLVWYPRGKKRSGVFSL